MLFTAVLAIAGGVLLFVMIWEATVTIRKCNIGVSLYEQKR